MTAWNCKGVALILWNKAVLLLWADIKTVNKFTDSQKSLWFLLSYNLLPAALWICLSSKWEIFLEKLYLNTSPPPTLPVSLSSGNRGDYYDGSSELSVEYCASRAQVRQRLKSPMADSVTHSPDVPVMAIIPVREQHLFKASAGTRIKDDGAYKGSWLYYRKELKLMPTEI